MNEIKLIHLGRQPFTIALDAHSELRRYLDAIGKHTSSDVIEEIEIRMAELLIERGFSDKKVVLKEDVDFLKQNLGKPTDFGDEDEKDSPETEETESRRLFRDSQNGILGGVAAGIAAYFGIPVWVVRIIFIGLTFAWGTSILIYILLWLILPDAKTPSERLQMSGKPVTAETIKEFVDTTRVRENAKEMGEKAEKVAAAAGETLAVGANGVMHATTAIGRGILAFVGILLIIAGLAGSLYTLGMGSYAIISPESLFDAGTLFPVGAGEKGLVVLGMALAVILFSLLFVATGLALVRRRWPLPGWLTAALIALFLAGGAIAAPMIVSTVPKVGDRYDAARITTTIPLQEFTSIDVSGDETVVTYVPGNEYKMDIESVGAVNKDALKPVIKDGVLMLNTTGFRGNNGCAVFCIHTEDVHIIIYAPKLLNAAVSTEATFKIDSQLNQEDPLTIRAHDGSSLRLYYMNPQSINVSASYGEKTITLRGFSVADHFDTIYDADMWGLVIGRAGSLEFGGEMQCDASEALIHIATVETVIINGKEIVPNQLRSVRNSDLSSDINCVNVR